MAVDGEVGLDPLGAGVGGRARAVAKERDAANNAGGSCATGYVRIHPRSRSYSPRFAPLASRRPSPPHAQQRNDTE